MEYFDKNPAKHGEVEGWLQENVEESSERNGDASLAVQMTKGMIRQRVCIMNSR
jgi:hypothetical protein